MPTSCLPLARRFVAAFLTSAFCLALLGTDAARAAEPPIATGIVFHDTNGNGAFDAGDKPLAGVGVSNGREVVATDAEGRYRLAVDDETTLFVIKPRGYRPPVNELQLPQFYYIHKPQGTPPLKYAGISPTGPLPASIDFALTPQDEPDTFDVIYFGDTQPRDQKEIDYIAHDVIEGLIGSTAAFGVTLGDVMFDDLSLYDNLNRVVAHVGRPWYNVPGNHDIDYQADGDRHSNDAFKRTYGPAYYSFNYGPVHFVVLDDVLWTEVNGKKRYLTGLGEKQLEFVRNDLARVPDEALVVLMMHIPLVDSTPWQNIEERQQLFRLMESRSHCISLSGHTHHHEHRMIGSEDGWRGDRPHHHLINGTVCGSWWRGVPDETGIPHATMTDGTPNGYTVMTFDGNSYLPRYRAARRPADYQLNIYAPEVTTTGEGTETEVVANVFNARPEARVRLRVGERDEWIEMRREYRPDPFYLDAMKAEQQIEKPTWMKLPNPRPCPHLWVAKLPLGLKPGVHRLHIRAENPDQQVFEGNRLIRVEAAAASVGAR